MSTSQLRAQDRRALIIGGAIVLVTVGYARVARPAMDTLSADTQALAAQTDLLARERALLAAAPAFPATKREAEQTLVGERSRLFVGDSVAATAELTAYTSGVAEAAGVHLTTVEGRTPRTEHGLTRLLVDVHGEGNWKQVLAFVRLLEASAPLVDVASVRLERGARGGPLGGDLVSVSASLAGFGRSAP